jgi:carbon-monoxide dehydrogenase medium subunit
MTLPHDRATIDMAYEFPASVEGAVQLLARNAGSARIIAGGTDLLPALRKDKIKTEILVDITRIPGLDRIKITDDYVEVGAAVTFAMIKDHPFIKEHIHALAEAARSVGALAIQNVATWVGNIVQAMPAADGAIIALALEAEAHIVDEGQSKWQPVESLFTGPGDSIVDPTCQFITAIRFPQLVALCGTAWKRTGRRPSLVLPIINCAVKLQLDENAERVELAKIALGPVGKTPIRARQAEAYLKGNLPGPEQFAHAAQIVRGEANPRDSVMRASRAYRLAIIPPMVESALMTAAQRAAE